jgi:signal transduction histidine kinase
MIRNSILIIDSDRKFVDNTALLLRNEGFEVGVVQGGAAAIERLSAALPDLILFDLRLSDEKGLEVLNKVLEKAIKSAKIIITGGDDEKIRAELLPIDAINFLSKPIENDVLVMTIKSALKSKTVGDDRYIIDHFSSLEKFFPFLAHEIRNPLHAIGGAIAIIQKRSDSKDEVLGRAFRIIQEEIKHLNDFVQECLDFVRPPVESRFTDVDMNEVANVAINVTSYMFEEVSKKVQVTKDFVSDVPKIRGNYEEIKRAFLNILRNSFEAIGENGKIHIQIRGQGNPPPNFVEILISDNGTGIKKEYLKSLFSPFFTTKLRGTGLGLPICHRIITERHHGKISIQSEEGKGTTVKIEFPVSHSTQAAGGQTT